MPLNVPRRELPGVAPAPLPGVRQRVTQDQTSFGGGPAIDGTFRASQGLAREAQAIALDAHARAEEALFNELDAELVKQEISQKSALSKVRGKDALQAADKALVDFDKGFQDLSKRATTERVRQRLGMAAERRRIALQSFAEPYAQRELEGYENDVFEAKMKGEEEAAIQSFSDPLRVAMALDEQQQALKGFAARTGKPRAWVDMKAAEGASRIHAGVVSQKLAAKDYFGASEYFSANKAGINPRLHPEFVEALSNGGLLAKSQELEDAIYAKGLGEREALAEARKAAEGDPKLKDMLLGRLEQRYLDDRRLTEQEYRDTFLKAVEAASTPSGAATLEEAVGVETWTKMRKSQRDELKALWAYKQNGPPKESEATAFTEFDAMSPEDKAAMTKQEFEARFMPRLSLTDFKAFSGEWGRAREAVRGGKSGAMVQGIISDSDMVLEALQESGLGGIQKTDTSESIGKDEAKAQAYKRFRRQVNDAVLRLGAEKKGPVTDAEKLEIIDRIKLREAKELKIKRFDMGFDAMDSDFQKRLADLSDSEIESEVIEMPWPVRESFFNLSLSRGLVSPGTPFKTWEDANRGRVNRAFIASMRGESDARIAEILGGK